MTSPTQNLYYFGKYTKQNETRHGFFGSAFLDLQDVSWKGGQIWSNKKSFSKNKLPKVGLTLISKKSPTVGPIERIPKKPGYRS